MAPAAVIIGDDERAAGTVTVKDLDLGRQLSATVSDSAAWRADRPGQATLPRAELIPFIRRILEGGA
jgi:histidyl-tRNA synthetase